MVIQGKYLKIVLFFVLTSVTDIFRGSNFIEYEQKSGLALFAHHEYSAPSSGTSWAFLFHKCLLMSRKSCSVYLP